MRLEVFERVLLCVGTQGATVSTAYLTLTCCSTRNSVTVNSYVTGEDTDDAVVWSDIANYQSRRGTAVGGANDDNRTTAQVAWDSNGL